MAKAQFIARHDINEKKFFIDIPFAQKRTCETVKVVHGTVETVSFSKYGVSYSLENNSMYYSNISEKYLFETKREAQLCIFDNFHKD